jgi:hypothetical protein
LSQENWPPTLRHFVSKGRAYLCPIRKGYSQVVISAYSGYPAIAEDPITCFVRINGTPVGKHLFISQGWQELKFPLPPDQTEPPLYDIELSVDKTWRVSDFAENDPRTLGLAVQFIGLE